ncbi:hypothetical protein QL285_072748 [Trifolium repens]|nr:hypothetical protein QL285_072748 [Trifolium repens]
MDDNNHNIKNEELMEYPMDAEKLNKWIIPSVPSKQIYKFGIFDISARFAVKTLEQTVQVSGNHQTIKLLTKKDLEPFKGYNFVHIGLIQIAFKPLTLLGLNSSLMAYVRDNRCKDFKQSLAAVIETSLCHGPVYFDVSPNLSLSLTDKNLDDTLQLNIHTNGYNYKQGSEVIAVCYRVYYKVLNTLNPRVKQISFPGTTTLVQTNLLTSNVATNRMIRWNEITFPESWSLNQVIDPEPVLNKDIDQIIQTSEGDVEIKFNSRRSFRIPRTLSERHQDSEYYSAVSAPSRASTSRIKEEFETVENICISENKIPHGIYQKSKNEGRKSPTMSEMSFHLQED